jgi:hypothetical protein
MPSLSSYDKGTARIEGKRYPHDVRAGNVGFDLLNEPLRDHNKRKAKRWRPERVLLLGNHEHRITRASEENAQLEGLLSLDALNASSWGWDVVPFLEPREIDGVHYCMSPRHKVLLSNLTYRSLGDVRPGDEIVGFDENGGPRNPRRFRTGRVLAATPMRAPLFRVTLRNGKTFDVTADHRWLARRRCGSNRWEWLHTHELVPAPTGVKSGSQICKPFDEWQREPTYEAGWLAGLFDGEGTLSKPNSKQGGIYVGFAQNSGIVLDRATELLTRLGVRHEVHNYRKCQVVRLQGTSSDKLGFLERVGAVRLLDKFRPEMLGRVQNNGDDDGEVVASVERIRSGDIIQIATSTKTMIVDGYAHHNCHYFYHPNTGRPYGGENLYTRLKNIGHSFTMGHQQGMAYAVRPVGRTRHHGLVVGSCYLHEEKYLGPQSTAYWRGIVVCHQVEGGTYDPMFVSLDYLCHRYERKTLRTYLENAA